MVGSDPIPDELLAEIAQLLAGPDGTAHKTPDGWVYNKPEDLTVDGGTVSRRPQGESNDT